MFTSLGAEAWATEMLSAVCACAFAHVPQTWAKRSCARALNTAERHCTLGLSSCNSNASPLLYTPYSVPCSLCATQTLGCLFNTNLAHIWIIPKATEAE